MKRKSLFLLSFIICCNLLSQNQYWASGYNVGLKFIKNNFQVDVNSMVSNVECNSSIFINDSSYFYSDGRNIYNRNNNIVLKGFKSEISSTQGSILLIHTDNDSIRFMIINSAIGSPTCASYY